MQSINTNVAALNSQRVLNRTQSQLATAMQRLASGLRINSAKDDAAGLAITERMTSQIRGMNQAHRNINDAISMAQTTEGALATLNDLFQRGRELAIQAANDSNSTTDRQALQAEINQLVTEVDRISETTVFNSVKVFAGGSREVAYDTSSSGLTPEQEELVIYLQRSWLEQGEDMLEQYFGITADGAPLDIKFVEGEDYLAAVSIGGYEIATG